MRDILITYLPREQEVIESFDVTLVVTMLNGISGTSEIDDFLFSETSALGAHIPVLCRRLKEHKRAVVCLAGRAAMWGLPRKMGQHEPKSGDALPLAGRRLH